MTQRRLARREDDLFAMINLYPQSTGLSMTVWASPRGNARHAPPGSRSAWPGGRG